MLTIIRVCGAILAVVLLAVLPTGCSRDEQSPKGDLSYKVVKLRPGEPVPNMLYVKGRVTDQQGNAISGVSVAGKTITPYSFGTVRAVKTDARGQYEIWGFPLDEKDEIQGSLIFTHPGYEEVTVSQIYSLARDNQVLVNVTMTPKTPVPQLLN
jgi:hypothetical protein